MKKSVYLISLFIFISISTISFSQETCNNGLDDDNNGLIDCFDPSCAGNASCTDFYFGHEPTLCPVIPVFNPNFGLNQIWQGTVAIEDRNMPVVADINNDGVSEIIVDAQGNSSVNVYDGATGVLEFSIPATRSSFSQASGVADTDGDGLGEIYFVQTDGLLYCYEHDGTPKAGFANNNVGNGDATNFSAAFADFNGDGTPEVYVSDKIFDANTGVLLVDGASGSEADNYRHSYTVAADVLPDTYCANCSGVELVVGNVVYSVDITTNTITEENTAPENRDGHTAVVDWDGDNLLDVVVASVKFGQPFLYIWNPRTGNYITTDANGNPVTNPLWGNHGNELTRVALITLPTIADFDSDGLPEIAMIGLDKLVVLDNDLSGLWTKDIANQSRSTMPTVFDFEGDGNMELIYRDQDSLYIWNAIDGSTRESILCESETRNEGPLVVDLDGDGRANILTSCINGSGGRDYLTAFNSNTNTWVETRDIWNQHNYVPAFINDDLSVPTNLQDKTIAPKQDVYRAQSPIVDYNGDLL